jgi:hypothetical protein
MKFLMNWLINHFLFSSTLFFAAGSVVLNDGAANLVPTSVETGGEGAAEEVTTEDVDKTAEGEQTAAGEGVSPVKDDIKALDLRTVSPEVKSHLKELAKTNPKLANAIQNAVYTSQTFLKEAPGGVKEIRELRQVVEDAGGVEEIQNLRTTQRALIDEQEDMDRRTAAGDPSVLDTFAEVAGEGFNKLMPVALDRWAQNDPDGYSYSIGKVMVQAMQESGVVASLNLAAKMINLGTPEAYALATEAFNDVVTWANKVGDMAAKPPQKAAVDPNIAKQQTEISNQQAQIFNDKFGASFGPWRNGEINRQVKTLAPNKQFTNYQMNALGNGVIQEVQRILMQDQDYLKTLERLYDARNMDELLKFTKSRNTKLLPEATKKVYRNLFSEGTLGTKKPAPVVLGAQPGQKPGTPVAPTVKGWVKIAADKAPAPDEIDNRKTDFKMKFQAQAILKDGRKVFWGDKVPK